MTIMNRQQKKDNNMKNLEWKDKVASFKKVDVRGIAGNFLDGLKKQAINFLSAKGSKHPRLETNPSLKSLEMLGYVHYRKQRNMNITLYFYRTEKKGT